MGQAILAVTALMLPVIAAYLAIGIVAGPAALVAMRGPAALVAMRDRYGLHVRPVADMLVAIPAWPGVAAMLLLAEIQRIQW